ncbi:MAG TPA: hypothetical protein VIY86_06900 [Pirellulaceae bacterium]
MTTLEIILTVVAVWIGGNVAFGLWIMWKNWGVPDPNQGDMFQIDTAKEYDEALRACREAGIKDPFRVRTP